jgi:tetratricopeptide (TPR) repeat protein
MFVRESVLRPLFGFSILMLLFGFTAVQAEQETVDEIQYREDYDRIQGIIKVSNVVKRVDQIVKLYEDRRDLNIQLRKYIDGILVQDMETLLKQGNYIPIRALSERAIKVRPQFGEAYLFYGVALKNDKKMEEAMLAFAKAFVIDNPLQKKAKQQLDVTYRSVHDGSLVGQDKIIAQAKAELK